jgi:hypothetical protein
MKCRLDLHYQRADCKYETRSVDSDAMTVKN